MKNKEIEEIIIEELETVKKEYSYGDMIEYIDGTWSDEFEEARQWAKANNTELVELVDKRELKDDVLHRYFEIKPLETKSTEEEQKAENDNI